MSEWFLAAVALPAGLLLGVLHFYGLRLTTDRLVRARRPVWFWSGSFLLRSSVVAAGLVLVAGERVERWALAVAGILLGRMLVVGRAAPLTKEGHVDHGNHAG